VRRFSQLLRWLGNLPARLRPARPSFERCLRDALATEERVTLRVAAFERAQRAPVQDS
jgi:hypothetical protein